MKMRWVGADTIHVGYPLKLVTGKEYDVQIKRAARHLLIVDVVDEGSGEKTRLMYPGTLKMRQDWRKPYRKA